MSLLEEDLKSLLHSIKGWYDAGIRVKVKYGGGGRGGDETWYKVVLCTDEHGHQVISELYVSMGGVLGDEIFLKVRPRSSGNFTGQTNDEFHRQTWRTDPVLIECSARALWPWLEIGANLSSIVKDVLES